MTDTIGEPTTAEEDKRRIIEDAIMAFRPEVKRDFPRDPRPSPGQPSPPWRPPLPCGG